MDTNNSKREINEEFAKLGFFGEDLLILNSMLCFTDYKISIEGNVSYDIAILRNDGTISYLTTGLSTILNGALWYYKLNH